MCESEGNARVSPEELAAGRDASFECIKAVKDVVTTAMADDCAGL